MRSPVKTYLRGSFWSWDMAQGVLIDENIVTAGKLA